MNEIGFHRLFAYAADSRRRFLSRFRDLGWDEVTRNREVTHQSFRNILVHILDVEESRARTETFIRSLTPDELVRAISVPWWKSKKKHSVEQILLHAFLDEIAHLGEMVALMWQLDEEAPWTSIVRTWGGRPPDSAVGAEERVE